jgi:hypothetical protein
MTTTKTRGHQMRAICDGRARTHLATVVRAAIRPASGSIPATLHLVISVDPFTDDASAHVQTYDIHPNGRTTLHTDSPYRTEAAAVAKFDAIYNGEDLYPDRRDDDDDSIGTDKPGPAEHDCRGW